jgi:F-type H+-transporting ATPase subunit b
MRRCLLIGMVLAALAVVSPAPLPAAEGHPHPEGEGKSLGVDSGLFRGAVELSLWTILIFVILLFVLQKYAWGPILAGLKAREEGIATDKREAERARKEASDMREKLQADMAKTQAQVHEIIAKARQDAQATAAEEVARGKAELQAERDRALREVAMERDQALQQIINQTVNLATLISSKAISKHLGADDHRALLNEALAEFRAAGQARVEDVESART